MTKAAESGVFPVLGGVRAEAVLAEETESALSIEVPPSSASGLGTLAEDVALVEGLVARHPQAWRDFSVRYDRLMQRCIAKVLRRFGSRVTTEDAREIQAQLVLSLFANDMHKLRSFDPTRGSRLSSWIGMLAMNAAYDYLRSIRREPNKATLAEAVDLPSSGGDPFENAAERERADLAARMLSDFSERDRVFATLYFAEGMDPLEIAERMNISVKTVYSKKHKIQSKLESLAHRAA